MGALIDRDAVYVNVCKGCTRHGDEIGSCCSEEPCFDLICEFASAPVIDAVEVAPELKKSVELLQKKYEKAKQAPCVRDPLAYALFQTWKAVDGRRRNGRD